MQSFLGNIAIGIVSGIITTVLLCLWYELFKRIFVPWFENRLYKGVELDGIWTGRRVVHHKDETRSLHEELNIQMQLEQSGYKLKGIFSAESFTSDSKDGSSKEKYTNMYVVEGHIHDNYVTIEYHPLSRKRTGMGIFLMEVKNGGKNLVGNITFLNEGDMEITTEENAILNRVGQN